MPPVVLQNRGVATRPCSSARYVALGNSFTERLSDPDGIPLVVADAPGCPDPGAEGHRLVADLAARTLHFGEPRGNGAWADDSEVEVPRVGVLARPRAHALREDVAWVRGDVAPWSGDGCADSPPATDGRPRGLSHCASTSATDSSDREFLDRPGTP